MKKLLSLLLVLMMLLSSIPAFANDADWEYNYDYAYIEGYTGSDETVSVPLLLNEGRVAIVPGTAFGLGGEGFARISYAYSVKHITEALARMEKFIAGLR